MNLNKKRSFALIEKDNQVIYYEGEIRNCFNLQELKEFQAEFGEVVFLNPFCKVRQKDSMLAVYGNEPLLALIVDRKKQFSREKLMSEIQDVEIQTSEMTSNLTSEEFADQVRSIQQNEIRQGNACQVVLSREFLTKVEDLEIKKVMTLYKRLLQQRGQYMTFLFANRESENPNEHLFIMGATPEPHIVVKEGSAMMCPLAGTFRKNEPGDVKERLKAFLRDDKEILELLQVLDETAKDMVQVCHSGSVTEFGLVEAGPVIHTFYRLEGKLNHGVHPLDALKVTLNAATLQGGPSKKALEIIHQYEKKSRGYYGGQIGVINHDILDSGIVIRTAQIKGDGNLIVRAGAGILGDSIPASEASETEQKARGFTNILTGRNVLENKRLLQDREITEEIKPLLEARKAKLSSFYVDPQVDKPTKRKMKITILNNQDNFAYMLKHILEKSGHKVYVFDTLTYSTEHFDQDLLILGPGPGDVNNQSDDQMRHLVEIAQSAIRKNKKVMGVCLGHQALAKALGLQVTLQDEVTQGVQREVEVFGQKRRLAFYNSFSPMGENPKGIECDRDENGRIIAMKGKGIIGVQFHPESIMSPDGVAVLKEAIRHLSSKPLKLAKTTRRLVKEKEKVVAI